MHRIQKRLVFGSSPPQWWPLRRPNRSIGSQMSDMKIPSWNLMFGDLDPRNQSALPRSKTSSVEKGSVPTWGRCTWSGAKRRYATVRRCDQKNVRKVELTKHVTCNTLPMAYCNDQTTLKWAKRRNANLIQIERVWRNIGHWATRSVRSIRFVNCVIGIQCKSLKADRHTIALMPP